VVVKDESCFDLKTPGSVKVTDVKFSLRQFSYIKIWTRFSALVTQCFSVNGIRFEM
jgi:hypothetical protein